MVIGNRQRFGERRDKAVEEGVDVIVVDIYIRENSVHVLLERRGSEERFQSEDTLAANDMLFFSGSSLVVFIGEILADRERDGGV